MSKRPPKFEALVVNAIKRLQVSQGTTANEIADYLRQEYNVSGPEIRRQIQMTIRRGINYGILEKSKRGYITCDYNMEPIEPEESTDCYSCKRSVRRSRKLKRSNRRKSRRSHKRKAKRHSGRSRRSRMGRRTGRSPKKHLSSSENPKSKKSSGRDEIPYGRQPPNSTNNGRSNSKSPTRSGDEKRDV